MKALFIARLQPLHLGHLHAIRQAIQDFDRVVIGIGSSNKWNIPDNPFSFEERSEMIRRCLGKIEIIGVEDKDTDEEWIESLMKQIDFDVVVTGSDWVARCFTKVKRVVKADFLIPEVYNGTTVRNKMVNNDRWEDLVPKGVAGYIKEIHGDERVRNLKFRQV